MGVRLPSILTCAQPAEPPPPEATCRMPAYVGMGNVLVDQRDPPQFTRACAAYQQVR